MFLIPLFHHGRLLVTRLLCVTRTCRIQQQNQHQDISREIHINLRDKETKRLTNTSPQTSKIRDRIISIYQIQRSPILRIEQEGF